MLNSNGIESESLYCSRHLEARWFFFGIQQRGVAVSRSLHALTCPLVVHRGSICVQE